MSRFQGRSSLRPIAGASVAALIELRRSTHHAGYEHAPSVRRRSVRAERFHVWAVRTIDEGIELLTGRAAGRRAADGSYPAESVHGFVAARLARYADRLRALGD
ncbi:MAG: hypothetical protein ACXVY6_10525, partial [Gaiellaceae bacterium]